MNRNVLIVLAGGFLIAVLVALLVQAALKGGDEPPQQVAVKEEPKVEIVVAAADIKIGDKLTSENVKWQEWPEKGVFPGAIVREEEEEVLDAVEGRVSRGITKGEPLSINAMVDDSGTHLSGVLEKGMRAFTVGVNATSMVAGFAGPGDYVDVLLTYKERVTYEGPDNQYLERLVESNIDSLATETILQNIKILAVDQTARRASTSSKGDDEKKSKDESGAKVGKNITLEVTPKQAEILAMAMELGDLNLALRGVGDDVVEKDRGPATTDARVTNIYDEVVQALDKAIEESGQNGKVIRVYRGENVQDITVAP